MDTSTHVPDDAYPEPGSHQQMPVGTIGYTTSYREQPSDIAEVSVVSVLEARGPE